MEKNVLAKIKQQNNRLFLIGMLALFVLSSVVVIASLFITVNTSTLDNDTTIKVMIMNSVMVFITLILFAALFNFACTHRETIVKAEGAYGEIISILGGERGIIDVLEARAKLLDDVFKNQSASFKSMPEKSLEDGEKLSIYVNKMVSEQKHLFWSLHSSAKLIGIEVKNSYKDYLPPVMPNIAMSGM
jgi:hypothetical protein